ncbi:pentapeptide repeat-containing protein [Streptomyces sp. NPDC059852]|uniref:pentapeptide repeat-containing protein n=1 Tax=Streptomyces sp. NPDC059852 TaxID=3346972 RepID=UPI003656EE19
MKRALKALGYTIMLVAVIVGFGLLIWKGPWWLDGDHLRSKNLEPADGVVITGVRTALVALGAGAVAAMGLYYSHQNHRHTERLFKHTRDKDVEQAALTREGQVTDRYVAAIKLLASDRLHERLGGIYSLERIARDSSRDHPTVTEVLAAYIRNPPAPKEAAGRDDVNAALRVLGRRDLSHDPRSLILRLRGAPLNNTDGEDLKLDRADLSTAQLRSVRWSCPELNEAMLRNADLTNAHLNGARLRGADLSGACLANADLTPNTRTLSAKKWKLTNPTDLTDAILHSSDLDGADLSDTVGLTKEQLLNTVITRSTRLPRELEVDAALQKHVEDCEQGWRPHVE